MNSFYFGDNSFNFLKIIHAKYKIQTIYQLIHGSLFQIASILSWQPSFSVQFPFQQRLKNSGNVKHYTLETILQ